jgi:hypothetical protein
MDLVLNKRAYDMECESLAICSGLMVSVNLNTID